MNRRISHICILLICGSVPALAGETSFRKFAGEFLATGVGARPLGMGGAFVALADDGAAGYWNPAGLGQLDRPEILLMHASRFEGEVNFDYFSISFPYRGNRSLGFSMIRLGIDNIADTRQALLDYGVDGIPDSGDFGEGDALLTPGIPGDPLSPGERLDPALISFFSNADYAFFLHYAQQPSADLGFGGNVKFIRRGLGEFSATGIGFDLAVLYTPGERWRFGANLQDVTSTLVAWDTGERELIAPTVKLGTAYRWTFPWFDGSLTPVFDTDIRFENRRFSSQINIGRISFDQHYGFELMLRRQVFLRGGFTDTKEPTVGAGLRLRSFSVDYAFSAFDDIQELGNSHRISVTIGLPQDRFRRK